MENGNSPSEKGKNILEKLFDELFPALVDEWIEKEEVEYVNKLYKNRLEVLYRPFNNFLFESEGSEILYSEIIEFEKKQMGIFVVSFDLYTEISEYNTLQIFSDTAFSLALETLESQEVKNLSKYFSDLYMILIHEKNVFSSSILEQNGFLISETMLDLRFSQGLKDKMSFRLKNRYEMLGYNKKDVAGNFRDEIKDINK